MQFVDHDKLLRRLWELDPNLNETRVNDEAAWLATVKAVLWGETECPPEALRERYLAFITELAHVRERGKELAELAVVYGPGVLTLPWQTQAYLRAALPHARALKQLEAVSAARLVQGAVPDETFFIAAGHDEVTAKRLRAEHAAALALRTAR